LWKEACPLITTNQIKTVLSNTSIKDQFTGSSVNNIWGNGKIYAYNGIKYILSQMPSKPRLSASGDTVICTGKSILLSAPAGFKKYMWTTGDTTRSISIDEEGEYFVFVQNDKGWWSSYSDTLNVYIDALEASISRYKPDNCLNSIYLKSSLKSDQSITWYKNDTLIVGANSATFIPKQSGIYKVRIENNDTKCFDISDTLKLDMSGYRNRLFNEDTIKSCSTDSLELDAGSGFKNYTWNTGAKTQKIKVGKTGTYSVQVSCGDEILNFGYMNFPQNSPSSSRSYFSIPDANQLDFKDEMSILLNLNIGSILSSRPTILNKGSDASYQIYLNWPMLTFSYPGMDRPKGVSVAVPQNTWFSISVVKTKDSLYMYYNGSIVDRAPAKNPIPTNNSPVVIGKRSGVDYDFFVGGIDQLSFWNRALSTAEIKNYINCTNGSESSCVGFYNFDPTENDLSTYKNHGSFYNSAFGGWLGLYGTNPFTICSGSKSVADSIHIKIEPLQNGKTSFSFDTRCIGQYINFNNTSDTTKNFPLQWKWDMGDGTGYNTSSVKHSYKRTGTYPVKLVLTSTICPKFKDSVINQLAITAPPQAQRYTPINVRKNSETPVQARNVGNSFKWKPGNFVTDSLSRITIAKVIKETDFQIHITNNSGCTVIDSLLLRVFDRFSVFVPSAFSPDGNGVNDKLKPLLVGIKEVKAFSIYSRWGNMIFSTKDVSIGWDGQFKGLPLPVDTYTWVFDGIDEDGKNVKMSGKTTLIR
jgi:gliding motility-associated-like protein